MNNLMKFKLTYFKHLALCRIETPSQYAWSESELPQVISRMNKAIEAGSFNKDSDAFKRTCKELGIKHTYKAIKNYVEAKPIEESNV